MNKKISFIAITAFVISLPVTSIWFYSSLSTPTIESTPETITSIETQLHTNNSVLYKSNNNPNWQSKTDQTSLKGTLPPTSINVIDGLVQQDEALKAIFEYFLSLDGEFSLEDIKAILKEFALNSLNEEQSHDVLAAFESYYNYLQMMTDAQEEISAQANFRDKLEWIKQKRRDHFGDTTAEAYFGYDEAYDSYSLDKLDIMNDEFMSDDEKRLALAEINHNLPEELRERESEKSSTKAAVKMNADISSTQSESELYSTRLQNFGFEATERLTELDQQRANWKARYSQYQVEANDIFDSTLTDEDKQAAIASLRKQHFNDQEIIRVTTLDNAIAQQ